MSAKIKALKSIIESRLGIEGMLMVHNGNMIIPNKQMLTNTFIQQNYLDDLFVFPSKTPFFSKKMMAIVSEVTENNLEVTPYYFELK